MIRSETNLAKPTRASFDANVTKVIRKDPDCVDEKGTAGSVSERRVKRQIAGVTDPTWGLPLSQNHRTDSHMTKDL